MAKAAAASQIPGPIFVVKRISNECEADENVEAPRRGSEKVVRTVDEQKRRARGSCRATQEQNAIYELSLDRIFHEAQQLPLTNGLSTIWGRMEMVVGAERFSQMWIFILPVFEVGEHPYLVKRWINKELQEHTS